jgi:hypothetical protein
MERETGLESVEGTISSAFERIHDGDSGQLGDHAEPESNQAQPRCTNAPNRSLSRRCDAVAVEILRAQLLWLEGAEARAVRRALLEALRLLDE